MSIETSSWCFIEAAIRSENTDMELRYTRDYKWKLSGKRGVQEKVRKHRKEEWIIKDEENVT